MAKPKHLELTVGAFVILAILCLIGFVVSISDIAIFEQGKIYQLEFSFANGLKKASPVRFAGVDTGNVKEIVVVRNAQTNDSKVHISVWMPAEVQIPKDSRIFINQLGLLGEKYVEIMPGSSQEYFKENDMFVGEDPVAMEQISKTIHELAVKFDTTMDDVNEGVLSKDNQQAFGKALRGMNQVIDGINAGILSPENKKAFGQTLLGVNTLVDKLNNENGTIGKFISNSSVYDNLDEFTADLKENPWKLFYRPKK